MASENLMNLQETWETLSQYCSTLTCLIKGEGRLLILRIFCRLFFFAPTKVIIVILPRFATMNGEVSSDIFGEFHAYRGLFWSCSEVICLVLVKCEFYVNFTNRFWLVLFERQLRLPIMVFYATDLKNQYSKSILPFVFFDSWQFYRYW